MSGTDLNSEIELQVLLDDGTDLDKQSLPDSTPLKHSNMADGLLESGNPVWNAAPLVSETGVGHGNAFIMLLFDSHLAKQAFPMLLVSLCGAMLTGAFLDYIQHWAVFEKITELFIMVPVLLNLKGTLEMSFASRLSTASNLGYLEHVELRRQIFMGNTILLQFQALIAGFFAGAAAWLLGGLFHHGFNDYFESVLTIASAMCTASLSSLITSAGLCLVVLLSRHYSINPDNVTTPLTASLGDLTTLLFLAFFGQVFFMLKSAILVTLFFVVGAGLAAVWYRKACANNFSKIVVWQGWFSIFISVVISSGAGLLLERCVTRFAGLALFLPVINGKFLFGNGMTDVFCWIGVCGNLTGIYASRMSTGLYANVSEQHQQTGWTLVILSVPIHLIFLSIVQFLNLGHIHVSFLFLATYMLVVVLQLVLMMMIVKWLVQLIWDMKRDPDTYTMPIISAVGDLIGTSLLITPLFILSLTQRLPNAT